MSKENEPRADLTEVLAVRAARLDEARPDAVASVGGLWSLGKPLSETKS